MESTTTGNDNENWSHARETVLLMNVAVARIEHAMIEGSDSMNELSQAFVSIADAAKTISTEIEGFTDNNEYKTIKSHSDSIKEKVSDSVVAFQFYDRLCQRMGLVAKTLNSLTGMLEDPNKANAQEEWVKLKEMIRSKYTLDTDQEMFDAVLSGTSIEDALEAALEKTDVEEVEFF